MKQIVSTLSLLIYRGLDWLKQKNPFWWAVVQGCLWLTFILISLNVIPTFGYKELILVFLGTLISGVGSRTTSKLNATKISAESFKKGFDLSTETIKESVSKMKGESVNNLQVVDKPLNKGQWIAEKVDKKQIVIHHSVSSTSDSIVTGWNANKERVGTAYSIDKDGTINQHFPDDEWAYHLYVSAIGNRVDKKFKRRDEILNKESIGIELVSMGGLTFKNNNWYSVYNTIVPIQDVYVLEEKYRGFKAFEKYTDAQIVSLKNLILYLSTKYNIPITKFTFNLSNEALSSVPGLYGHQNMRSDKSDIFNYPPLTLMLNSLITN
jgi:N-acetyl-anhydromuramyl-L-alanine amidase AmpD